MIECFPGIVAAVVLAASPSLAGDEAEQYLRLMREAYGRTGDYASTWRLAEGYSGTMEDLERYLSITPDLVPYADPVSNKELWTLTEGSTLFDAESDTLVKSHWAVYSRPWREEARTVQIFRPSQYIQVAPGDEPAHLIDGTGASADEVRASRKRGELTAGDTVGTSDFLGLVRRALLLLPGAADLRLLEETAERATIGSKSLGITCTIDRGTGECVAASFAKPGKPPNDWEVLDWFPEPIFPGRHPSLVRREWVLRGEPRVELVIYDRVHRTDVATKDVEWSTYADSAWDRIGNRLLAADGSVLREVAHRRGATFHPSPEHARPRPIREAGRTGVNRGSDAASSRRPTAPPPPPMPISPLRIALFGAGGGMVALGVGLAIWRRMRS